MNKKIAFFGLFLGLLGCSGGTDGVSLQGAGREGKGPGSWDNGSFPGTGSPTTSISPLEVLCIQACARVHAADCGGAPIEDTASCDFECQSEIVSLPSTCVDEMAELFTCTYDATVSCTSDIAETPIVSGCSDEEVALDKCLNPTSSGGCEALPGNDIECQNFGFSRFFVCANGSSPGPECLPISSSQFCCP